MDESNKSYTGISAAPGNAHHTTTGSATTSTATGGPGGQHLAGEAQSTGIGNDSSLGQTSTMAPPSQAQSSTGMLSSVKNAIFGNSSSEPISGVHGNTAAGQPYDAGNMPSSTHSTTGTTHHTPGTTTETGAASGGVIGSVVNAAKNVLGMGHGSTATETSGVQEGEYGPHSSRVANALDPRVDSDLDGRGATGSHMVPGQYTSMSSNAGMTGTTGTHTGSSGVREGEFGPHNSRIANALDPRVDSDLDGRGVTGTHTGTGLTGSHTGHHGVGTGAASAGVGATGTGLAAHHADHNTTAGTTGTTGTRGGGIIDQAKQAVGLTSSHSTTTNTGTGVREGEYGPHNSRIANALDPRVDSDLDGRGATGSHHGLGTGAATTGAGVVGAGLAGHHAGHSTTAGTTGTTGTRGGGIIDQAKQAVGLTSSHSTTTNTGTGVREGEYGPHTSRIANALDPRVDSDLDGRGATGTHTGHYGVGTGAALAGAGATGTGLAAHHAGHNTTAGTTGTTGTRGGGIIDQAKQAVGLTPSHSTTTNTGTGVREGEYGPHNSRIANALDPRVDSDLDGRGATGSHHGLGTGAATTGTGVVGAGLAGHHAGHHVGSGLTSTTGSTTGTQGGGIIDKAKQAVGITPSHHTTTGTSTGITSANTTGNTLGSTTGTTTGTSLLREAGIEPSSESYTERTPVHPVTNNSQKLEAERAAAVKPAHAPGQDVQYRSGGTLAEGGSFDASAPGAGPEAQRLIDAGHIETLEEREARHSHGHHGLSSGANAGVPGTAITTTGTTSTTGTHNHGTHYHDPSKTSNTTGTHHLHSTGTAGTGLGAHHVGQHIGATGTHTGTGLAGSHTGSGVREGQYGPHSSRIANALDPRVDSDLDGRGASGTHTGTHTGTGITGTHTGTGITGTHTGTGITGTHHNTTSASNNHGGSITDKAKQALGVGSSHNTSTGATTGVNYPGTGLTGTNTTASGLPGQGLAGHSTTTGTGHVDQLGHDVKHMNLGS